MSRARWIVLTGISLLSAGCALHPLPDDVTGVSTYDIVRNIRCEARDAVRDKIILFLGQVEGDPAATKYAQLLKDNRELWLKFNDHWFSPPVTAMLQRFEGSAIAYNFNLDMTEINNFDPKVDLASANPIPFSTFTSAVTGGVDHTRENARTFTITDIWASLIRVDEVYCQPFAHVRNYMYPITGKIGVDEMVDTFVVLSLFANLAPAASGKPPTMADDLKFTTMLSFGATPTITFTPFKTGLSVADASLGVTLSRRDLHEVTVGLSLPLPATSKSKPNELLVTAAGGPAQQAAAQAVEQRIYGLNSAGEGSSLSHNRRVKWESRQYREVRNRQKCLFILSWMH